MNNETNVNNPREYNQACCRTFNTDPVSKNRTLQAREKFKLI